MEIRIVIEILKRRYLEEMSVREVDRPPLGDWIRDADSRTQLVFCARLGKVLRRIRSSVRIKGRDAVRIIQRRSVGLKIVEPEADIENHVRKFDLVLNVRRKLVRMRDIIVIVDASPGWQCRHEPARFIDVDLEVRIVQLVKIGLDPALQLVHGIDLCRKVDLPRVAVRVVEEMPVLCSSGQK